jgi:uncharacterized protein YdaT
MLARARIRPGATDRVREWYRELEEREDEVVETLRHEGAYTETAFVEADGETAHLYVFMEAEDLEEADEAGDEETYEIDEEHHEVLRETLTGGWEEFEPVGHFVNPGLR